MTVSETLVFQSTNPENLQENINLAHKDMRTKGLVPVMQSSSMHIGRNTGRVFHQVIITYQEPQPTGL